MKYKYNRLPHFIALPVKMGDSFLLKDKKFSLLVDGGDGRINIKNEIRKHTEHLDVIICTHYDKDHIQGLLDLVKYTLSVRLLWLDKFQNCMDWDSFEKLFGLKIKEIWLPDIFERIQLFEEYEKRNKNKTYVKDEGKEILKKDGRDNNLDAKITVREERNKIFLSGSDGKNYIVEKEDFDMSINIIYELVTYCYSLRRYLHIDIVWFSYTGKYEEDIENSEKGFRHNIYPINCKKVERTIKKYGSKVEMINEYLTKRNVESLTFRYNAVGGQNLLPNVLFTADSNFSFYEEKGNGLINDKISIVTTPHHGSSNPEHDKVYEALKGKDCILVRSSESHDSRPCENYKKYPKSKRFCVRCGPKGYSSEEQTVYLKFGKRGWGPEKKVKRCTCADNIFKGLANKHKEPLLSFLQEELLTKSEMKRILKVDDLKISKMISKSEIIAIKVGSEELFLRSDIESKKKS
ncbi:Beta-lactamase domain protein [Bacillus cereus Rock1-15]|uniref:MBL fold metallo-hydrolase n=1 Tax=Bacillus cereus TaxID=1396 RepID=UPI0001A07E3E|nr:MBL fold metallo-hydrolase [Bacillus cereus]EEL27593.1 Beta-lactamase domain protein [Bacillus cereus Rock1-15]